MSVVSTRSGLIFSKHSQGPAEPFEKAEAATQNPLSEGVCSIPPQRAELQKASFPGPAPERHSEAGQSSALILSALITKPQAVPAAHRWGCRGMAGQGVGRGCGQLNPGGLQGFWLPAAPPSTGWPALRGRGHFAHLCRDLTTATSFVLNWRGTGCCRGYLALR